MKMGNHGWGMKEMVIYMCVFSLILFFVAISINSLYKRVEKNTANSSQNNSVVVEKEKEPEKPVIQETRDVDYAYYAELENKVYNATVSYLKEKPTDIVGILKITDDTLISLDYLEELYNDNHSQRCTAYSNVYTQEDSEDYIIKSYVRCDNYSSNGY